MEEKVLQMDSERDRESREILEKGGGGKKSKKLITIKRSLIQMYGKNELLIVIIFQTKFHWVDVIEETDDGVNQKLLSNQFNFNEL